MRERQSETAVSPEKNRERKKKFKKSKRETDAEDKE